MVAGMADTFTPCGRGVCAAEDGHDYPCAIASGWATTGEIVAFAEDRARAAEEKVARVEAVLHMYRSCGPKQQSTRDVLNAVEAALSGEQPTHQSDQQPETD